jgi:hypothetical protein
MLVGFAKIVDVTHCTRTCKIQHSIPKAMATAMGLRHSSRRKFTMFCLFF